MKLTFYGHACFGVEIKGHHILFDPFISPNPLAVDIDINQVRADYIFISHGHEDHVADCVHIAKRSGATCVAAFEVCNWLEQQGVNNVHPINHGGFIEFDFGRVKATNAIHSSSFPDGRYAGNPLGFLFDTQEDNFYYSGDTALTLDMQLIPLWTKLDFAVLPIGSNFTMDVADAIRAASFIQCNKIVGVHYDTFGLIKIDKEKAKTDFEAAGISLVLPKIGETVDLKMGSSDVVYI